MKKWMSKGSNIFFILLFAFMLFQQIPLMQNNFSKENELIKSRDLTVLGGEKSSTIEFPPRNSRIIAIFWATWCGPCKIEMARLKTSVESGAIPSKSIFAINPFESNVEVKKFLKENDYPFTFLETSSLPVELGVNVTPTTLFIDNGRITKMSSGMSIWGIWQAEYFL